MKLKPYFDLDNLTTRRILELIEKCEELDIDNVCFIYFPKQKSEVKFYIVKNEDYWDLSVIHNWEKKRDIYKIKGQELTFSCTLHD